MDIDRFKIKVHVPEFALCLTGDLHDSRVNHSEMNADQTNGRFILEQDRH